MKVQKYQTVNYRNGIYQGPFNPNYDCRQGFGLLYNLHTHSIMGSIWNQDEATGPTIIYYNQNHYMYGYWKNNIPSGINVIKIDNSLFYVNYRNGKIVGNLLAIFEKYNLAVVVTVIDRGTSSEFQILEKGQLYSDEDFERYLLLCKWEDNDKSYKTMIRFITSHLTFEGNQNIKKVKLRLINQQYYRYGFDEGLAVVFDDEYRIISAGLHKKASLKSLGIKFTRQKFAEEGDFGENAQVYSFQLKHRPEHKIGKLYSNYLLKSTEFVNKYLGDPSTPFIEYFRELIHENIFKQILSGQITNRKIDFSLYYEKDSLERSREAPTFSKNQNQKEDDEEIKKMKLQILKKEIYENIEKKKTSKNQIETPKNETTQRKNQIITKSPVGKIAKVREKNPQLSHSRNQKKRERIFTPESKKILTDFSPSPDNTHSPFKQKMRSKIFNSKQTEYQSRGQNYDTKKSRKNEYVWNQRKYQSPHEALQCSLQENEGQNPKHIPLSFQPSQKQIQSRKIEKIKKQKVESFEKQNQESPKKVTFVEPSPKKYEKINPYESSQKNKVYLNGQVNYEPIENGEVKKNSYYDRFQRQKSKSRSPYDKKKEDKKPDKYNEIVKKFNESKKKKSPNQKVNNYEKMGAFKKRYQYYFP